MKEIILRVKHFDINKDLFNDYCDYCPIEKSICEVMGLKHPEQVSEYVAYVRIERKLFRHEKYGLDFYEKDRLEAIKHLEDPKFVIRTIKLIPG